MADITYSTKFGNRYFLGRVRKGFLSRFAIRGAITWAIELPGFSGQLKPLVKDTLRGAIVFVTALLTIALWVPLRNHPELTANGTVISETYFGFFNYVTLRTELKEPDFHMFWLPNKRRIALTAGCTAALWLAIFVMARKKKKVL